MSLEPYVWKSRRTKADAYRRNEMDGISAVSTPNRFKLPTIIFCFLDC